MAWLVHWGLCHPLALGLLALPAPLWMRWGRGRVKALGLVVSRAHITVSSESWWLPWAMDGRPMWVEGRRWGLLSLACGLWPVAIWNPSRNLILNSVHAESPASPAPGPGEPLWPPHVPWTQVPPPETLLGLALFPEKMQGRLGRPLH